MSTGDGCIDESGFSVMILFRVVLIASGSGVNDLFAVVRVVLTMAEQRAYSAHFCGEHVVRRGF